MTIFALIPGWLKAALVGLAALAMTLFGARRAGKREGRLEARAKAAEDAMKRADAGRQAAAKAKADLKAGKTPEEIARDGDGKW